MTANQKPVVLQLGVTWWLTVPATTSSVLLNITQCVLLARILLCLRTRSWIFGFYESRTFLE